jgi:hypothetical protein
MQLKTYYPMPRFPAISLSGPRCELNCLHCSASYLAGMQSADTPERLLAVCRQLAAQGAVGALLSGGSDARGGILNLSAMVDAIADAKRETGLVFNIHPGLIDQDTAQRLRIDFASLEIPADATITRIFGLQASTRDYLDAYTRLRDAGIDVVPHITVYSGDEDRLLQGVESPRIVVVIVFAPTPRTAMESSLPPSPQAVGDVVRRVGLRCPEAEVALGCMRPRTRALREAIERAALDAGASRIEMPSRATLAYATDQGYTISAFDACCALPERLEHRALRG